MSNESFIFEKIMALNLLKKMHEKNNNITTKIPKELVFNETHVVAIVFYSVLMLVSAVGNICVLIILIKRRKKSRSRINNMLIHLAIADLFVTFVTMPIEIVWSATVSWQAGDVGCRLTSYARVFGLYLSSFVIVSIGIDRYYAVLKPLQLSDQRGKYILSTAWMTAALCSLPQLAVFTAMAHPEHTWFHQCIGLNLIYTSSILHGVIYPTFGTLMLYVLPLIIIVYCYGSILAEICKRAKEPDAEKFRRSNPGFLGRAKNRTLKMTITIIFAFFICWTPFYVISVWYLTNQQSAKNIDPRLQKALFLFACTNSSVNPIVYGIFNIRRSKTKNNKTRDNNTITTDLRLNHMSMSKNHQKNQGSVDSQ